MLELGRLGAVGPDRVGRRVGPVELDDQRARVGHLSQLLCTGRSAEQLAGSPCEIGDRKARRPVALGFAEDVEDARAQSPGGVGGHVDRARDRVGGVEADAEHAGQLVRAFAHDPMRSWAVVLLDAGDEPGEAVWGEQEVQGAARAEFVPGLDRFSDPARAEPHAAERGLRIAVDDLEHVLAVELEQALGSPSADVTDALQIHEQRGLARGRERLGGGDLDLQPVALVVLPLAADPDPLALLEVGDRPDERDLVAVPLGVDDREARLVARPATPPDQDLILKGCTGDALDHVAHSRPCSPEARAIGRSTAARTASSVPARISRVCARVTAV